MYKNDRTNGSNGHGRPPLTRLTDKGVEVVEAPTSTADERTRERVTHSVDGQNRSGAQTVNEQAERQILGDEDDPASLELLSAEDRRGRVKRFVVAAVIVIGLLVVLAGVGYLWLSSASRAEMAYRVKPPAPSADRVGEKTQGITAEEIAREMRKPDATGGGTPGQNMSSTTNATAQVSSPIRDRLSNEDYSATVAASNTGTLAAMGSTNQTAAPQANATNSPTPEASLNGSSFTVEHSIHVSASQSGQTDGAHVDAKQPRQVNQDANNEAENSSAQVTTKPAVPRPPLGTMLPVRTLGTVFTLRSDSYVRLELTREVSGRGWSLPRGTEFYGTVRGAELETGRAFVSLFGFVDKSTNRLVRLEGNLLGGDGADGMRGRRHKLNAGWSGALKKVGAGVLDVLSTVATGVGNRPVVISDVYGSGAPRVINPISSEIGGITNSGDGRGSGFVEVPAGTPGYILVTTIPQEIQAMDADASMAAPALRRLSDANVPREQGQLSEQELAELLTNGSADDILRALPRMTPEMRRVAESYLANK